MTEIRRTLRLVMGIFAISMSCGAVQTVSIHAADTAAPVGYVECQLETALSGQGFQVVEQDGEAEFHIELKTAGEGAAEGYAIRAGKMRIEVEGSDVRGTMYGAFALCEAIEQGRALDAIEDTQEAARFPFRAVKFNLPWDSYRAGEALALHDETCRDLAFWESFLDMMARNRFNTLTLWSLHPFHRMIRNARFPEACTLSDAELAEWQTFWHGLFALARERGIDTYLVQWNIFVSPAFAEHHGVASYCTPAMDANFIGPGDTSAIVKEYTRSTIAQVIDTYPNLTGLGVSVGERMGDMTAQEREDWILETIVAGMRDAKRPARLIHRAPFSAGKKNTGSASRSTEVLTREALEQIDVPGPIWVEVKFNWSHAHSSPHLVHVHGGKLGDTYWNPPPKNYRICWMARNEDFFCLRWSEPGFVRQHIALNGQSYVGGYFVGSECYIPATDYMTRPERNRPWRYAFERQWLYYMTWGRLLYNPETPDGVFATACETRYGPQGRDLFEALRLGSRMPLRLASLYKATWDFTLYSEGFSSLMADSNPDHFIGIEDLIEQPVLDPAYQSISDFVRAQSEGRSVPDDIVTPLRLADELETDGRRALELLGGLGDITNPGLAYEAADAEAWACLSLYSAEKLRGAVAYHQGDTEAVEHLTQALHWWDGLIRITEPIYAEMPLAQLHRKNRPFHWKRLRPHVARDLELARAKVGS